MIRPVRGLPNLDTIKLTLHGEPAGRVQTPPPASGCVASGEVIPNDGDRTRVGEKPASLVAIYPGSFDPFTNGHLDLIERCTHLVDKLVVAILRNESKQPLFTVAERVEMLKDVLRGFGNVEVDSFEGLLVDYAARKEATVVLRGIRAISDYEYELQMALMNRRLHPEIETVFLMASEDYSFISSRMVKEVAALGGSVSGFLPPAVEERLKKKLQENK